LDIPFTAVLPKTVQVVLEFRGVQRHLTVQDTASQKDFEALAKNLVGIRPGTHVTTIPLGFDDWQIRAGFVYWMAENRQMEMQITDTKAKRFMLKIAGDSSLTEVIDQFRRERNIPEWNEIKIRRADDTPFWIEDHGNYLVEIMYDPVKDPRPACEIQVVCSKESQIFLISDYRAEVEDPVAIWNDLCSKYGFTSPGIRHLTIEGNPRAGKIKFTYRLPASVSKVNIPAHQSRTFKIFSDDGEAWDSGEILSPATAT
jgi:hypothetical protein